jgi:hypothetical protein
MLSRKIETSGGQVIYRTVDELISPINGQWDDELLRLLFNPFEVQRTC